MYWVGGYVGGTYMAFAVWLPYDRWVKASLPVIVHFRPYYVAGQYGEAAAGAAQQGVPQVLAHDKVGQQPFLDGAWYYVLGFMAFVQQLLSVLRTAIIVVPIPPKDIPQSDQEGGSIFPKPFIASWPAVVLDAVGAAIDKASDIGAGKVIPAADQFIVTANSRGGLYLINALKNVSKGVREIWMFDCLSMDDAWAFSDVNLRLYIAQPGSFRSLFQHGGSGGDAPQTEREGNDWSVVDISRVPAHGSILHDLCGRLCFSHAAALSSHLPAIKPNPKLLDVTLTSATSCWDRLEFWKVRMP